MENSSEKTKNKSLASENQKLNEEVKDSNDNNESKVWHFYSGLVITCLVLVFVGAVFLLIAFAGVNWDFDAFIAPMNHIVSVVGIVTGFSLFIMIIKEPTAVLFYPRAILKMIGWIFKGILLLILKVGEFFEG